MTSAPISQVVSELASQGRWEEAYSSLYQFAQQNPGQFMNDPTVQYQLGVLAFNNGKIAEAERHIKTSLSIASENPTAHYQLGLILLKDGHPAEAMPCFREACERRQDFAVGHLHWGMALLEMNSIRGAIGQFNQAVKIDPRMTAGYIQGGLACFRLGQFMEAAQYFQAAVNIDPELTEALVSLGVALAAMGNEEDASKCFIRAWQIDPKDVTVMRFAAAALAGSGRLEEAVRLFQDAVNLTQRALSARERALIHNDWGAALFRSGMAEEASEKLLEAADMDPQSMEPVMNLGLCCVHLREFDRAAESFEKALALEPENNDLRVYLAVTYILMGRCREALIRLDARRVDGLFDFWLGHAYLGVGDLQRAAQYFSQVLNESPNNYQALDGLGCALLLAGNYEGALEKFSAALAARPDYALAHLHLSKAYDQLGQDQPARQHLELAVQYDPECLDPQKEALDKLLKAARYELVESQTIKLLAASPRDCDLKVALARSFKEQQRFEEALEVALGVIAEQPTHAASRLVAGQIYMAMGRFVEADEMFREAAEVESSDPQLYYFWGKTLSLLGLQELALEKYEKASEIDPYDGDIYDAWGAALKSLGRFAEAADVYRRAAEYI
ncbi:MAG: tetratricopeptide repeat protein [Cyanobacteria bacterium SZAS LIN-2]|nr:tetratricopeptide repeat protein [Cyanobacteria bacterium SZAS LIN-3]MBS1996034.1 tetratricopeptide repeat protein [Cyanobacteria bacterium SZAS LIN-2]MBS2010445.1 tetratricopeptide repeat protein [Cyanobacteria bacterium SZAS TMP-1]